MTSVLRTAIAVATFVLVFQASPLARAQEASPSAASLPSSSSSSAQSSASPNAWEERSEGFRALMLQSRRGIALFHSGIAKDWGDLLEYRRTCREMLRKANRDARFDILLRCTRGELTRRQEAFARERDFLQALPGIPALPRSLATARLDLLSDALGTVVGGIDAEVFLTEDELRETLTKLRAKYTVPSLLATSQARAEGLRTWIAHLLTRLLAVQASGEHGNIADLLVQAEECFAEEDAALEAVGSTSEHSIAEETLTNALEHLSRCSALLRAAKATESNEES